MLLFSSPTHSSPSSPSKKVTLNHGYLIPKYPEFDLPSLPDIPDPVLRRLALTHKSFHAGDKRRNCHLIYSESEQVFDNEKLEFQGDGLLTASVITLLHHLYPAFGPGPATFLRSVMCSNKSLAQLADQYRLPDLFIASQHNMYTLQIGQKAKGSLFEAYVAGVYYSYLSASVVKPEDPHDSPGSQDSDETIKVAGRAQGPREQHAEQAATANPPVEEQDDPLPFAPKNVVEEQPREQPRTPDKKTQRKATQLKKEDTSTPQNGATLSQGTQEPLQKARRPRTHGEAFDYINAWLWEVFKPLAKFYVAHLERQTLQSVEAKPNANADRISPIEWANEDRDAIGATSALHQWLQKHWTVEPIYVTRRTKMGLWNVVCMVTDPNGEREWKGEAARMTKKGAQAVSAHTVWRQIEALKLDEDEDAEDDVFLSFLSGKSVAALSISKGERALESDADDSDGEDEEDNIAEVKKQIVVESTATVKAVEVVEEAVEGEKPT